MFNLFKKLQQKLMPKSLPFREILGGSIDKLNNAVLRVESKAYSDALSIIDSTIPDNANFSASDADEWERRLGIVTRPGVSLDDRKKAITLKLNYPLTSAPRQHYLYIEEQLRAAGFNVRVYENNFGGVTRSPEIILGAVGVTFHSTDVQHGNVMHKSFNRLGSYHDPDLLHGSSTTHGAGFRHLIANDIDRFRDAFFIVGPNLRSTFFIAGDTFPDFADVPAERETEFRQLILQLKPVQTIGYLFVNYI